MMRRRVTAVVVGSMVALSACAPPPPSSAEAPEIELKAATVEEQYERIIDETFAQLAVADAERDAEALGPRIAGLAREIRAAQYALAGAEGGTLQELPSAMQAVYVTGAEDFPRILVGVSEVPGEGMTPVVYLWVQDEPTSDYALTAWARMIPGAALPAMSGVSQGARQLALGEARVEPSPRLAWEDYLDLLREGPNSDKNDEFGADTYRERLFASRGTLRSAARGAGGDYLDTIQPDLDNTYVLSTADGGALIFAPVTIASSFSVRGARVSVSAADRPLLSGSLTNAVTHHYKDFVVLYVSGPGVDQRPVVVAADHYLVKVASS